MRACCVIIGSRFLILNGQTHRAPRYTCALNPCYQEMLLTIIPITKSITSSERSFRSVDIVKFLFFSLVSCFFFFCSFHFWLLPDLSIIVRNSIVVCSAPKRISFRQRLLCTWTWLCACVWVSERAPTSNPSSSLFCNELEKLENLSSTSKMLKPKASLSSKIKSNQIRSPIQHQHIVHKPWN